MKIQESRTAPWPGMRPLIVIFVSVAVFILSHPIGAIDSELRGRILKGDKAALESVSDLAQAEQFEIYYSCLHSLVRQPILRERNPGLIEGIAAKFVDLDGHETYLGGLLTSNTSGSGRQREAIFEVASKLPSEEVKGLLMDLVFDERILDSHESLLTGGYSPTNSSLAVSALGAMELPDSPLPDKNPLFYDHEDVKKWQEWAKERQGVRDQDTVGISPPQADDGHWLTTAQAAPLRPAVEEISKPLSLKWSILIGVIALLAVVLKLRQRDRT